MLLADGSFGLSARVERTDTPRRFARPNSRIVFVFGRLHFTVQRQAALRYENGEKEYFPQEFLSWNSASSCAIFSFF